MGSECSTEEVEGLWRSIAGASTTGVDYFRFSKALSDYKGFSAAIRQVAEAVKAGRSVFGKKVKTVEDLFAAIDREGGKKGRPDGLISLDELEVD